MASAPDTNESIAAGETASIENLHSAPLAISLVTEDGCKIEVELAPAQILNFTAGGTNAMLQLHGGDPAKLRVIKPTDVI